MLDNRISILNGKPLLLNKDITYEIIEEIGRGGSCIVYSAFYIDLIGLKHKVRIKECYPYNIDIKREKTGELVVDKKDMAKFEIAKEQFYKAYEKNVIIKNTLSLINSTIDSAEIYKANNTIYSIMSIVEGEDYRNFQETCLKDVFIRMETLAKIIQKYHQNDMLHLDIKPENILIIPETKEHMVLFDFDSLLSKEQLKEDKEIRIFFSDGFSAPELVSGKREKICEATDIYSIGAIVFEKVFSKKPTFLDGAIAMEYDFTKMNFKDNRYQPDFYRKLSVFFHKTLASSVAYRYKKIENLLPILKELEQLSDMETTFLQTQFSYHAANFVGRNRELDEMDKAMLEYQVVFVSGIGGIGKTELVKRYVYEYQEQYRRIVFVSFHNSIMETVCSDEMPIHNFAREEREEEQEFFERKLTLLKNLTTKEDLIILDNFDVEYDDNLENLLECPCKFIITTREDFRDYNYKQINLYEMEQIEDLVDLFKAYNPIEYSEKEWKDIVFLIELVERHTMTVELIAKYLRTTKDIPVHLLNKMMEKEGIINTEDIGIKHRKDKKMRMESIDNHLQILFDLSGFSDGEKEFIQSLSLLGYVRIRKELFFEYLDIENKEKDLDSLVKKGWIIFDEKKQKISLHQIILDLVYNHMKPSSENCPHIVEGMIMYIQKNTIHRAERKVKHKLLDYFVERVIGEDVLYATLLIEYCSKIRKNQMYLEKAKEITKGNIRELENENESIFDNLKNLKNLKNLYQLNHIDVIDDWKHIYNLENFKKLIFSLMQNIYVLEIKMQTNCDDLFEVELEMEEYFSEKWKNIYELARKAYFYGKSYLDREEQFGKFCIDLAYTLDRVVSENQIYIENEDDCKPLKQVFEYADYLFYKAEQYLLKSNLSYKEKEKLFQKIQEFYAEDDFLALYRSEREGNLEKSLHYQEILDELREETEQEDVIYIHTSDVSYYQLGQKREEQGNYQEAISFYQKELEEGEELYETVYHSIAKVYLKMNNVSKVIEQLETVLFIDKRNIQSEEDNWKYSSYICEELIELLLKQDLEVKAKDYIKELLYYNRREKEEEINYSLCYLIYGNNKLFQLEENPVKRQDYWNNCITYYEKLSQEEELFDNIVDFVLTYAYLLETKQQQIDFIFSIAERFCSWGIKSEGALKLWHVILEICKNSEENKEYKGEYIENNIEKNIKEHNVNDKESYILALVKIAEHLQKTYIFEDIETALSYCERALKFYENNNLSNEYISSLIHKTIGGCYSQISMYNDSRYDYEQILEEKKKCNYYFVGQIEAKDKPLKKAIEIWEEAGREYSYIENWEMMEQCYLKVFALLKPVLYQYEWSDFEYYWSISVDRLFGISQKKDTKQLIKYTIVLFEKLIYYKFEMDNKWNDEVDGKELEKEGNQKERNKKERNEDSCYDFSQKLSEIAYYLVQVNCNIEAFPLYILAMIAYIVNLPKKSLCQEVCNYLKLENSEDGKNSENSVESFRNSFSLFEKNILYKEWEQALHCPIEENMVDRLLYLWEDIETLMMPQEMISKYEVTIQWFLDTYQYQDIEFKR